ncbi:Aldo/keto reductase [Rhizopogon salebrosus TDB-379]|nr:Aldo/keto reductase [Rhizopogon salebrosus TDB-379]
MPTVEYRTLGRTGLKSPRANSVEHQNGLYPWVLDEEPSIEIMKAAWDLGINTIDTANIYSNGESGRLIGKFIKKYNIPLQQIVIAAKCHSLVAHDPSIQAFAVPGITDLPEYVNQSGLSRAAIFNAVDASVERLDIPYIDLLQIHRFDPSVTPEKTMKALHDLVQSGEVHYIGASSMRCWHFAMLNEVAARNGWTKFVSMQNESLPRGGARAAGVLARPVGTETARLNTPKGTARVEELSKKKDCKMSQIALAWVAANVESPIIGANSVQRLQESIVKDIELTQEEMEYLEEL